MSRKYSLTSDSALKITNLFICFAVSCLSAQKNSFLIFESGYEGQSAANDTIELTDIVGFDDSAGFDWTGDLDNSSGIGNYFVEYTGGSPEGRWARIIEEPGNSENHVLWFNVLTPNASNGNGRVQSSIYGNEGLREFTIRNRVFLHPDFGILINSETAFSFLTLFEFWNDANWVGADYPFRISFNLIKSVGSGQPLNAAVKAQTDLASSYWRDEWYYETDFEFPVGKWIDIEIYLKEGDESNGRLRVNVTPQDQATTTIFDLTALTHHPDNPSPDGYAHFNPQKLYTSEDRVLQAVSNGGSIQVYWDDFQFIRHDLEEEPGNDGEVTIRTEDGDGADARVAGVGLNRETFNDGGENKLEIRGNEWSGGAYLAYLRFDISQLSTPVISGELSITFATDNDSAVGEELILSGLMDGFAGGEDGYLAPEVGENWIEGTSRFSTPSNASIAGDIAPGFNEQNGLLHPDYFLELGRISLLGSEASDTQISIPLTGLASFIESDTNGLVTFVLHAGWRNGSSVSFRSKEGSSFNAPQLQLITEVPFEGWAGFPFVAPRMVNTESFLGYLHIDEFSNWVYSYGSDSWIYLPESNVEADGAWTYIPRSSYL